MNNMNLKFVNSDDNEHSEKNNNSSSDLKQKMIKYIIEVGI